MIDLARLADFAGGILGQGAADGDATGVLQHMTEQGLDPAQLQELGLQDLAVDQILPTLAENGIDLSQLDAGQLTAVAENLGLTDQLPDLLSQLTDRSA